MKLGENLNSTFDCIYMRNLPEAVKRRKSFEETANSVDLKYKRVDAIKGYDYVPADYQIKHEPTAYPYPANQYLMGNFYTFTYILLDAMSNNYNSFVYCDDDVIFNEVDISYIKPLLPDDWDVIILGRMCMNTKVGDVNFIKTSEEQYISGSHCVAINKKFYYKLMDSLLKMDTEGFFGDRLYHLLASRGEINLYMMMPDITRQERELLKPYTIE